MNVSIIDTVVLSLKVSVTATVVVMVLSFVLALWLMHHRSKFASMIEMMTYLPMAMPPVALGYGLLVLLGKKSLLGQFFHEHLGVDFSFSLLGAQIAGAVVSLGLGVRCMRLAFLQIDHEQVAMAYLLGASRLRALMSIVVPQCLRAFLGGALLVFLRIISEFGATMVFAGTSIDGSRTLAIAIWTAMEVPGQEHVCLALVCISLVFSLMALCLVEILVPQTHYKEWEQV